MRFARRGLFIASFGAPALAQTAPLRIIVPAPPGGSTDILARSLAERAGAALGQAITIDNRGGAGGIIGTEAAARATADGSTLILGHNQTHASNQWMARNLPYHVLDSFVPVARLATVHHATVVPNSSRARAMADLAAMGRNGGRVSYASSQAGSASHVIAETFIRRSEMEATHIPYRGGGPATTDTVAGVVDFFVSTWPQVVNLVRDGRLRALSIGAAERIDGFPALQTATEAGVPYMAVDAWFGLFAPRGTAGQTVQRLAAAFLGALADADSARRVEAAGLTWPACFQRSSPLFSAPKSLAGRNWRSSPAS